MPAPKEPTKYQEWKRKISEFQRNKKHSETTKRKMSETHKRIGTKPPSNLGKKRSEATKRKIGLANSISLKGNIPWNKGLKGGISWNKGKKFLYKARPKMIGHIPWNKGQKMSDEFKKKVSEVQKGKKLSTEHKKKISQAHKARRQESNFWKGGITPI